MKVVFDKAKLIAALTPASGISQIKNTLSTSEGILFECPPDKNFGEFEGESENVCRISAFDLEKGLRTSVECKIYKEGKYILNTSRIMQIVRALPDGDITIDIDENMRAKVSGGNSNFEISVDPGEDFPTMPVLKGDKTYVFPQYLLKKMINETIFSAAQNDQRVAFNGEFFRIKDNIFTVVACDGNRMSCVSCETEGNNPDCEVIIPAKFLSELNRMIKDSEDEVTMIIGNKHIIFKIDEIYFFCRRIENNYLDYEKVIPRTFESEVFVNTNELKDALERASIISEDKLGGNSKAIVKLNFEDEKINVTAVSVNGSIFESVPAAITGPGLTIGFTCRLLLDAIKSIPDNMEEMKIGLNSSEKGIIIEPSYGSTFIGDQRSEREKDENENFIHFIMPRRMNG